MYDTLKLWLPIYELAGINYKSLLPSILTDISEHSKNNEYYITGSLNGLNLCISDKGISVKGSLCKYYLSDNIQTLTRQDTQRAIEQLSDTLNLPVYKSKVSRLDTSHNFMMNYEPELYYAYLGESKNYQRLRQPHSLYYSNGLRKKLFYNKIEEAKSKRVTIPNIWQDKNVIRYELRFESRLAKQFNETTLTADRLYEEKFYINLIDKWHEEYKIIQKNKRFNLNYDTMKKPKDLITQMALLKMSEIGQDGMMQFIEELKANNCFEHKEYYSRLKADIKRSLATYQTEQPNELISELSQKIKRVTEYYR